MGKVLQRDFNEYYSAPHITEQRLIQYSQVSLNSIQQGASPWSPTNKAEITANSLQKRSRQQVIRQLQLDAYSPIVA